MAFPKTTVPRQAPKTGAASSKLTQRPAFPAIVEDDPFEEVDESDEVEAVPQPLPDLNTRRLTVNDIPCRRIQVAFGKDQVCIVPGGSVVERFWDLYDHDEAGSYSRPRLLSAENTTAVSVTVHDGTLDIRLEFPKVTEVTRLPVTGACLNYDPL